MSTDPARPLPRAPVVYPESDGEPTSDNTEQFDAIVTLRENLNRVLPDAFVAGNILWYPVEGDPTTRIGPDVLVALGRPKGPRGSYLQWEEGGHVPDVVFEAWSPKNRFVHQLKKLRFYDKHGIVEFWTWDLVDRIFAAFVRREGSLEPVSTEDGWTSPLLGVHFEVVQGDLVITGPDGQRFRSMLEVQQDEIAAREAAASAARERDDAARERDALRQRLLALGVDPDAT